jgi:hypothetical protein
MDSDALRKYGKEMIDFVADYWDSLRDRQPVPDVQPGFMREMVWLTQIHMYYIYNQWFPIDQKRLLPKL